MDLKNLLSLSNTKGNVADILRQADEYRDSRQYNEAASLYQEYLNYNPRDFGIWVQLGNALKDSDQFEQSERAYKTAIELNSDDYDVFLQLGHLLKLRNRKRDALEMYRRSFKIKPSMDAAKEISLIDSNSPEVLELLVDSSTVNYFFEIDDLLNYLNAHPTLSGIQRVQAELIRFFGEDDHNSRTAHFVIRDPSGNDTKLKKLRASDLLDLVELVSSDTSDHERIRGLISRAIDNSILISPKNQDIYLVVGAFWGYSSVVSRYRKLKNIGVSIGVYIYDIIPISHPAYCDERLAHDFLLSLGDGLALFDFIFTISEFTAREVRKLIDRNGCRNIPVEPVLLAHVLDSRKLSISREIEEEADWTDPIVHLKGRDYVLFVSTIEARKNHDLVMRIWEEMLRSGKSVPDLVFVGRRGWRVDALFEKISATDYLDGHLHLVHDLSDREISTVYKNCLFTVFPSFVEGWGLPVGESLVAGRPCAASNTSSIPEVGGDFVDYFDPLNFVEAFQAVTKLCFDKEYRSRREANIIGTFVPRTWAEVGEDIQNKLRVISSENSKNGRKRDIDAAYSRPSLDEATFFKPKTLGFGARLREDYCKNPIRLGLSEGWYAPENFGCWMQGRHAIVEFATNLLPGEEVVVVAQMASAPHSEGCRISMFIGEDDESVYNKDVSKFTSQLGGHFNMTSRGVVDHLSNLVVTFELKGKQPAPLNNDTRSLSAGLLSLAYAKVSSVESRLRLIELMLFDY
jgi:glycosyltransferase involved in cell wall biosynthesis